MDNNNVNDFDEQECDSDQLKELRASHERSMEELRLAVIDVKADIEEWRKGVEKFRVTAQWIADTEAEALAELKLINAERKALKTKMKDCNARAKAYEQRLTDYHADVEVCTQEDAKLKKALTSVAARQVDIEKRIEQTKLKRARTDRYWKSVIKKEFPKRAEMDVGTRAEPVQKKSSRGTRSNKSAVKSPTKRTTREHTARQIYK